MSHQRMTVWILALAALLTSGALAAPAAKKIDQVYLVVDQEAMTKGELDEEVQGFYAAQGLKPPAPGSSDYEMVRKQVQEAFIREVLLAEAADKEKIEVPEGDLDQAVNGELANMKKRYPTDEDFEAALKKEGLSQDDLKQTLHDQLQRRMKANRMMQTKQHDTAGVAFVTDEEVRAYYQKRPRDFEQVKFAIILFRIPPKSKAAYVKEVENQAQDLLAKLKAGADFAAFAKKYSEDPVSADRGGQMDPVYRVDLNPKLANGIFAIPNKGMGVVKAEDGVYIVRVDRKSSGDYDSVAPAIKDHLRHKKQGGAFAQWLDGLKKSATIIENGKVVQFKGTALVEEEKAEDEDQTPAANAAKPAAGGGQEVPNGAVSTAATPEKQIYPTLPSPGTLVLDLGAEGFGYSTKDLSDFYGPSVNVNQGFPFGFGLNAALDLAIDPTFELGITARVMNRVASTVNFAPANQSAYLERWSSSAVGPGLEGKVLIPLDESTNFILSAGGGYYFLLGAQLAAIGPTVSETVTYSAENLGGEASGAVEFFLDGNMDAALDLFAGYRLLQFQPVATNLLSNTNGPYSTFASPLTKADGSQAMIDLSGIRAGFALRFYLGK